MKVKYSNLKIGDKFVFGNEIFTVKIGDKIIFWDKTFPIVSKEISGKSTRIKGEEHE